MFFQLLIPAVAAGAGALVNLIGGISASRKRKQAEKAADALYAQRPTYEIPESYKAALETYKGLEGKTESMFGLAEGKLQQEGARARTTAREGAISSTGYMGASADINQKMFESIRDMEIKSAEMQLQNEQMVARGQEMMGVQEEKAQDWRIGGWTTGMNRLESKGASYAQQAAGYWQGLGSGLMNFAGTAYAMKAMKQQDDSGNIGNSSKPLVFPNPTQNITNTASGMLSDWQKRNPYGY